VIRKRETNTHQPHKNHIWTSQIFQNFLLKENKDEVFMIISGNVFQQCTEWTIPLTSTILNPLPCWFSSTGCTCIQCWLAGGLSRSNSLTS